MTPADPSTIDPAQPAPDPAADRRAPATVAAPAGDPTAAVPDPGAIAEPSATGDPAVTADPSATGDPADLPIVMRDVSRRFDDREVVRGIDLTVARATILGVIGPSGAGKTTTIRMLTGAIAPSSGEIAVLGKPPKRFSRRDRERIGYMPQTFTLYEDLTTSENIDFVASLFGLLWRRRRKRVREVLKLVDLWDARNRRAGQLSGGMQRRLELACALVHEPELVILDEPTAGIDPLLRGSIWEELHRLRDAGRTLLVTTQHVSEAEECDAVAMIVGGQIIALAPPDELRRMATNGDLLDVETSSVYDGSTLVGMEGVGEVTQDGPRHFRVVVEDAGTALPLVVEQVRSAGTEVESAREHRLSFDEIFAILVARYEAGRPAEDGDEGPEAPDERDPRGERRGAAA
ncbi:MAG TPA: ABC transporter ATP-binding protein [Candidatus Limnocylindrales bacterium]|nr:ABC transporter ATP-binding protein [Candidatus Limnocylindrales bacterium]